MTHVDDRDRAADALRDWTIEPAPYGAAAGRVIIRAGRTTVLCTASVELSVPPWMTGQGQGLGHRRVQHAPRQHRPAKARDRGGKVDGRTTEIQRLIGRSLRAVVDLDGLGERSVTIDCDVLEADGGTRTAAHHRRLRRPGRGPAGDRRPTTAAPSCRSLDSVAAVSVGIVDGRPRSTSTTSKTSPPRSI